MTYTTTLDAIFEKVKAALFHELEDPAWVLSCVQPSRPKFEQHGTVKRCSYRLLQTFSLFCPSFVKGFCTVMFASSSTNLLLARFLPIESFSPHFLLSLLIFAKMTFPAREASERYYFRLLLNMKPCSWS